MLSKYIYTLFYKNYQYYININNIYDNDFVGVIDSLLTIPKRILKTGTYYVSLGLASSQADKFQIESIENFLSFEVSSNLTARDQKRTAVISLIPNWR